MTIVCVTTCMPASMIPWQGLIGSDGPIFKFSDKGMDTDLSATGSMLVPVIVVLVLPQEAIIWSNISTKIWVIGSRTMDHNALGLDFSTCFIAFIAGIGNILKNKKYVGDDFYPAIIDNDSFEAAEIERLNRAKKLGRIWEKKEHIGSPAPTSFSIADGNEQFDDPFKQAEYAYSLIEMEVENVE